MTNNSPSKWPCYSADEIEAVKKVLSTGKGNSLSGQKCKEFEIEFAKFSNTKFAVALMNGTVALEASLKVLGVGPGDEVIVTPRSFIASVSCVVNVGARPIFADVDINSGNITSETISSVISEKTKAVICVHIGGWPCEMDAICHLSKERNFFVIEDCSQAHGAKYKGQSVGSFGDIGTWSFCHDKIISTGGEGGMVTTNDSNIYEKLWSIKDHGKDRTKFLNSKYGSRFNWLHDSFGTNLRMTEMQAAIGIIQLRKIDSWKKKRTKNAYSIQKTLELLSKDNKSIRLVIPYKHIEHAYYRFYFYLRNTNETEINYRDQVIDSLNNLGLYCFSGSCSEIYNEKAFLEGNFRPKTPLTNAKLLGEQSVALLVHPTMSNNEINFSIEVLKRVLKK